MGPMTPRAFALPLLAYLVLLSVLAFVLPGLAFQQMFSEHGAIEMLNAVLWLIAALVFVVLAWRTRDQVAVLAVFPLLAAGLRELDLHNAITGYSVLKVSFWLAPRFDLLHKLVAAAVLLPTLLCLGWLLVLLVRRLRAGGLGHPAIGMLLLAVGLLVFSKVCDRAPAVLAESYGVDLPAQIRNWSQALEEGIELLLPVLFSWAWFLRDRVRRP